MNSAGIQPTCEARNGYGDGQLSVDATELANLACASSLDGAGTSSHQSNAYDSSSGYGWDATASASDGHIRVDSRGATGSSKADLNKSQMTTQSLHSEYRPSSAESFSYPSQAYNGNNGRKSLARQQNAIAQTPQQPIQQQAHPKSRQAVHPAKPRTAPPSNPSPSLVPFQSKPLQSGGQQSQPEIQQSCLNGHLSNLPGSYPAAQSQQPTGEHRQSGQTNISDQPQHSGNSNSVSSVENMIEHSSGYRHPSSIQPQMNGQRCPTTPFQEHHPTTVDPSQVFNDYEYQRRKDEKFAKKKAAEVARTVHISSQGNNLSIEASRSGDARSQSAFSQSSDILEAARAAIGSPVEADAATKEQMELEMRQMIEKMREYKTKDPGLFLRIWEQVKKVDSLQ